MKRSEALKYRGYIEKSVDAALGDTEALGVVKLFPHWNKAATYAAGQRVQYDGTLYRCLQPHTAQETWTPTAAPSLWDKVLIPDPNVVPDWEQPGSTNGYSKGDRVRFEGKTYESLIDNNVWSPAAYPAGWAEVTE